ncbi:Differentially expressed in FDCP 8 homolog [Strongyloides ratti]|uniref:Differentially expressed in FDCP 8 homolog n=1 Tax=Strongyloides ratti TaxID=34506 RepID=A0A090LKL6_STRRB|nr:Differentially expressed in FDCP 8 homolog [Strongyloides ratti]CEF70233.1 Differentially expressed in FDCP 8 homolog [Strongyloides ratti]
MTTISDLIKLLPEVREGVDVCMKSDENSRNMENAEMHAIVKTCNKLLIDEKRKDSITFREEVMSLLVATKWELFQIKDPSISKDEFEEVICIKNHQFVRRPDFGDNPTCECCRSQIWRRLQNYYRCKLCGFKCHFSCTNNVHRKCVGIKFRSPNFKAILDIRPESSLYEQNFQCYDCGKEISLDDLDDSYEMAKLCDYSGKYFCGSCHWDDEMPIPARLALNTDSRKRGISRSSKEILQYIFRKPLIKAEDKNKTAFCIDDHLNPMKKYREDILRMKRYFTVCRHPSCCEFVELLQNYQHYLETSDMYSLKDLYEIKKGRLVENIGKVLTNFRKHISSNCDICQELGYICELCNDKEVIYPFNEGVVQCCYCSNGYHIRCFLRVSAKCPNCERIKSDSE